DPGAVGELNELDGLIDGRGNGLFHEHVHGMLEELAGDLIVEGRRDGQADRIDLAEQHAVVAIPRRLVALGERVHFRRRLVDDTREDDVGEVMVHADMVLAPLPQADYADTDRPSHGYLLSGGDRTGESRERCGELLPPRAPGGPGC